MKKVTSMSKSTAKADSRARLVYDSSELDYNFGPHHPLKPARIVALIDLLETSGLWHSAGEQSRLPLRAATVEELSLAHTTDYIAAVQKLSIPEGGKNESEDTQLLSLNSCFPTG